jgi:anti-anti-sigma regulatory factor
MKSVAMYTPEQHERIQLGLRATRPEDAPTTLLVAITANLVATNAPQLRTITDDAIDQGRITITLDFAQCPDIDKRGFEMLVSIANRVKRKGESVTIAHAHRDLVALFHSHGIASLFRFEPTEVTP